MADVKRAKTGLVRILQNKDEVAGHGRGFEPADRHVLSAFRTDLRNYQERREGHDVDVIQRRRLREPPSRFAIAGSAVGTDGGDPLANERQPGQRAGRRIVEGENPAVATLEILASADEGSQQRRRLGLGLEER